MMRRQIIAIVLGLITSCPVWAQPDATKQCQKVFNNEQMANEIHSAPLGLGLAMTGGIIPLIVEVDGSATDYTNVYQCIVTTDADPKALEQTLQQLEIFE